LQTSASSIEARRARKTDHYCGKELKNYFSAFA